MKPCFYSGVVSVKLNLIVSALLALTGLLLHLLLLSKEHLCKTLSALILMFAQKMENIVLTGDPYVEKIVTHHVKNTFRTTGCD